MGLVSIFKGEPERGPKGDHGQDGAPGHDGARGPRGVSAARGLAAIFLISVAGWILMFAVWQDALHDRDVEQWQSCKARQANVARTNGLYRGLIRIEEQNPYRYVSPETIKDRIELFTDAILVPPACGARP